MELRTLMENLQHSQRALSISFLCRSLYCDLWTELYQSKINIKS